MSNPKYDYYKSKHPEWSDEQIWTAVSLDMESAKVIDERGEDINPNDPDLISSILNGARNWLKNVLPTIFAKVAQFFDKMLSTIETWISKGLNFVIESIAKLLGRE